MCVCNTYIGIGTNLYIVANIVLYDMRTTTVWPANRVKYSSNQVERSIIIQIIQLHLYNIISHNNNILYRHRLVRVYLYKIFLGVLCSHIYIIIFYTHYCVLSPRGRSASFCCTFWMYKVCYILLYVFVCVYSVGNFKNCCFISF